MKEDNDIRSAQLQLPLTSQQNVGQYLEPAIQGLAPFFHGGYTLRRIGRPATPVECGTAILDAKGRTADPELLGQVVNRVSAIFSQKADAGQVRRAGNGDGRQLLWEIAA